MTGMLLSQNIRGREGGKQETNLQECGLLLCNVCGNVEVDEFNLVEGPGWIGEDGVGE